MAERQSLVRTVIVDDHEVAREGLKCMLLTGSIVDVVGEATTGTGGLELCRRERPDVAILDMRMPRMDGLTLTGLLTQELPEIHVILVTVQPSMEAAISALRAGAYGFVGKDLSRREALDAVRRVARGERYLPQALATKIACMQLQDGSGLHARGRLSDRLTERELEVLSLMARGHTNRMISRALTIAVGTAKVHVERIIGKLEATDRTQAVVRGISLGLIHVGES